MCSGAEDGEDDCGEGEQKKTADLTAALALLGERFAVEGFGSLRRFLWMWHRRFRIEITSEMF